MNTTRTIRAFAKINLGLQILEKRGDGYHNIETVFHRINLYDDITVREYETAGIALSCTDPAVPADSGNLCYTAAKLFFDRIGKAPSIAVHIDKTIPAGAGLGGGSSDAAATLLACNEMYNYPLDGAALSEIAAAIGSDVPYFLHPGSAHARGRGELLEYFTLELPYWIVLANPSIPISTKWAYESFSTDLSLRRIDLKSLLCENIMTPRAWVNTLRNDFESIVFAAYPEIMRIKETLIRGGADFALMSGSGSSVFGLFQDERYAREIADALSRRYGVWITPPFFSPESITIKREHDA
jgi:4-diphosphocytidyl-2-C-methyl-D-erythritol kinase